MNQSSWSCDKGTHTGIPVVILLIEFLVSNFSYSVLLGVLYTHCLRNPHLYMWYIRSGISLAVFPSEWPCF